MVEVLETISTYSPLGIRFWDPAVDAGVTDALRVTARHADWPGHTYSARRSRSGIYFFEGLHGFRHYDAYTEAGSPAASHRYIIEVEDPAGRYASAGFGVDLPLPYNGLFLSGAAGSPGGATPRGFNLYSSVSRSAPAGFTAVRGELYDDATGDAAAHALIRVNTGDGYSWYGVTDEAGRFAVVMPYPAVAGGIVSSPGSGSGVGLYEQTWPLDVAVFYEPAGREPLPGSSLVDYLSVLTQSQAAVYESDPGDGGIPQPEIQVDLGYGRELVLRSTGSSRLVVSPAGSPI